MGVISLHLLETHEGGLLWAGKPSALHFRAKEGSKEREVVPKIEGFDVRGRFLSHRVEMCGTGSLCQ